MIDIKKSDIESYLVSYHQAIGQQMPSANNNNGIFRGIPPRLPKTILMLDNFIKGLGNQDPKVPLTADQLHQLLFIVLSRKTPDLFADQKKKLSEEVARKIERAFGARRMALFYACAEQRLFDVNAVRLLCDAEEEKLPRQTIDLTRWLAEEKANSVDKEKMRLASIGGAMFPPVVRDESAEAIGNFVVRGNLVAAKELIEKNPSLLNSVVTVTDFSNRTVRGTPLQLALGAEDIAFVSNEESMVSMILSILKKQEHGELNAAEQIIGQFPEGWEAENKIREVEGKAVLDELISSMMRSDNRDDWSDAANIYIEALRKANEGRGVIETGYHGNPIQVLQWLKYCLDAGKPVFKAKTNESPIDGHPAYVFLWQRGAYCERYLPSTLAMALMTGLASVVFYKKPLDRSLRFRSGQMFYPLTQSGGSFDELIMGHNAGIVMKVLEQMPTHRYVQAEWLETLIYAKRDRLQALRASAVRILEANNRRFRP